MEKGEWGSFERINSPKPQNEALVQDGKTSKKIAAQLKIGHATVEHAAEYTLAIDTIEANTGIDAYDILSSKTKGTHEEIKKLAALDVESQKRVAHFIFNEGEADLEAALNRLEREKRAKILKEAEEMRLQLEAQSKIKRDEEAVKEKERLRIEHEALVKQENELMEKEKEEAEKLRLAEIERQKKAAEEKAKNDTERERIRKEAEELKKAEIAKAAELLRQQQELEKKRLEEHKRAEEERIKQAQIEKEKKDKEKVEEEVKKVKVEIPKTPYDPYIQSAKLVMGGITLNACQREENGYINIASQNFEDTVTLNENWTGKVWLDILGAESDSKL